MLFGVGMFLLMIGISMGESESLIVPTALIAVGAALMYISSKKEDADEN